MNKKAEMGGWALNIEEMWGMGCGQELEITGSRFERILAKPMY